MIWMERGAPGIVHVRGIDLSLAPQWRWRRALVQAASRLQQFMRQSFGSEKIAGTLPLLPYGPEWGRRKVSKGWDLRKGHQLNRIQRRLGKEALFGITRIVGGTATITYLEELLYAREPHARHYAYSHVPGGRILVVNPAWFEYALAPLRQLELQAERKRALKAQRRPITFGPDIASRVLGRRAWTLAQTAWRAAMQSTLRLRRL